MRYRLGSFIPRPGSSDFANLLPDADYQGALSQALEEMLKVRLSTPVARGLDAPDLLKQLGPDHPDRPWVAAIHDRMRRLVSDGLVLRLLACDYEPGPDGFLTVAASAPGIRLEVLTDDWMQVGFAAMREGAGPVRAWPRLLREVCANGSLVCISELDRHEGARGIAEAVETFLDASHYGATVAALREARLTGVIDPREYLDESTRMDLHKFRARIRERFRAAADPSLYGLFNAITSTARDADDWRDRLDLEEFAGQIAWLRRPTPSRTGGTTLLPA